MRTHLLITTAALLLAISVPAFAQDRRDLPDGVNSNSRHSDDRAFGRERAEQRAELKELRKDRKDGRHDESGRPEGKSRRYDLSRVLATERERQTTADLNRRSSLGEWLFGLD